MEEQRVRISDIAEELGLSTATVSNVIHGKTKKISEETQKRVMALLEEKQYIPSMVGSGIAVEFRTWTRVYDDLPDLQEIFDGKNPKLPTGTDAMYALTAAMTAYARAHKEEIPHIANSVLYADRMPPDFSAMLMKDYMYIEKNYREKLLQIPAFSRWLSSRGRLINGVV